MEKVLAWQVEKGVEYIGILSCSFLFISPALGSTPSSGRAAQQMVEGRFNHGVNFFDAFCHQDGVGLSVWTQQLHHTMTSCAQSTFTCNVMQCLLLESVPSVSANPQNVAHAVVG